MGWRRYELSGISTSGWKLLAVATPGATRALVSAQNFVFKLELYGDTASPIEDEMWPSKTPTGGTRGARGFRWVDLDGEHAEYESDLLGIAAGARGLDTAAGADIELSAWLEQRGSYLAMCRKLAGGEPLKHYVQLPDGSTPTSVHVVRPAAGAPPEFVYVRSGSDLLGWSWRSLEGSDG